MDNKTENLKAQAFDLIRIIDSHTFEIQRLREQLNKLNQQIIDDEKKDIPESKIPANIKSSKKTE